MSTSNPTTNTRTVRCLPTDLRDQEHRVLEACRTPGKGHVSDGIVCLREWSSAPLRIVFILKEANDHKVNPEEAKWDLRCFLEKGAARGGRTWNNIVRWTGASSSEGVEAARSMSRLSKSSRQPILRSICAMNLKKAPGKGTTNIRELRSAVSSQPCQVRAQLDLYSPLTHLFVACGKDVSWLLHDPLGFGTGPGKSIGKTDVLESGAVLLHWRHPNARGVKWTQLLEQWIESLERIRRDHGFPSNLSCCERHRLSFRLRPWRGTPPS